MTYRFDLLGPLRVSRDETEIPLVAVKQRQLLAGLLLRPNEIISTDELLAVLWAGDPPASAAANLRTYVRGLRQALGSERLPSVTGGYQLRVEPGERDLDRFESAVALGRAALADGRPDRAAAELAEALGIWRGAALAGLPLTPPLARRVRLLEERRLLAEEDHAEARLASGEAAAVVQRLRSLVDQHPLRQRACGQLMTALYRTGDISGALEAFRELRSALAERTGLDPAPELVRLHDDILHQRGEQQPADPRAAQPPPDLAGEQHTADRRPAQLPLDAAGFIGRQSELARLDGCLDAPQGTARTVVISSISGMPGVGKTALALHWAHRVAGRFPDGQLYLNLRGYDDMEAVSPAEALRSFLEALGVPDARMPVTLDARVGLYRSLLASRHTLILLDNARDADQVRPLLPGAGGSVVVITSRDQLTTLVATERARSLTLDVLSREESERLLANWLGPDRTAREPAAVADIVEASSRLPLALAIAAARIAVKPDFPLAAFAAELRPHEARLDALSDGDVRRVFSWSYRTLSEPAARLFGLLGLHPGPDVTVGAAAALAGEQPAVVQSALRELIRRHLLTEHEPGRYTLHDLLRTYAAELVGPSRQPLHRLFDHYLHTACAAARLLQPQWPQVTPVPPLPDSSALALHDRQAALDWFTAEHHVLIRVVRQMAETGFETYAWQLAWAVTAFLAPRGLWQDQFTVHQTAVAAARRSGDRSGQAMANRLLARAALRLGDHDEAEARLDAALALYEHLDDVTGQAQTLHSHTELAFERGRPQRALAYGERALRLNRSAGSAAGEARSLNAIGYVLATIGDYHQAVTHCTEALAILEKIDDRNGQAATLDSLAFAYERLGDHEWAVELYERSVELFRDSADRYHEAETLTRLGRVRDAMGDAAAAREAWLRAVQIYDALGDPAADEARRHLDSRPSA